MTFLLIFITFAGATLVSLSILYALTAEAVVSTRLHALVSPVPHAVRAATPRWQQKAGFFGRLLAALGRFGFGGNDAALAHRVSYAGLRSPDALLRFVGARTLLSFGPALAVAVAQIAADRPAASMVIHALLAWGVGHVLANLWLRDRAVRATRLITQALPDSLDLMVVCLEAGLSLNMTIARVGQERASLRDPLGDEFDQVAFEMRAGRSREDALRALGERNGVDDLKALVGLIIQSDRLGASMAQTLRVHADLLRTKRWQRAEELARKLPVKLLLPMAFLILLPWFLLVITPAIISFKEMARMMTQG